MEDQQDQVVFVSDNPNKVLTLKEHVAELTEQVALLTTTKQRPRSAMHCFYCNQLGYVKCQCPAYQYQFRQFPCCCYNCGRVGQLENECRQPHQGNFKGMPQSLGQTELPEVISRNSTTEKFNFACYNW